MESAALGPSSRIALNESSSEVKGRSPAPSLATGIARWLWRLAAASRAASGELEFEFVGKLSTLGVRQSQERATKLSQREFDGGHRWALWAN